MADNDIVATFNGRCVVSFVQGEDRAIAVSLRDCETGVPLDLTGAGVHFEFVGTLGQPVRRFSDLLVLGVVDVAPGVPFALPNHGLVTGDPVKFTGGVPTPLVVSTTYLVVVADQNTFSLTDTSGNAIAITGDPSGPFYLAMSDVTVNSPASSGLVTLLLRAPVTAAIQEGLGQTFQIEVLDSEGMLRIVLERNDLDVWPQVVQ
jgi:hypothetical protein